MKESHGKSKGTSDPNGLGPVYPEAITGKKTYTPSTHDLVATEGCFCSHFGGNYLGLWPNLLKGTKYIQWHWPVSLVCKCVMTQLLPYQSQWWHCTDSVRMSWTQLESVLRLHQLRQKGSRNQCGHTPMYVRPSHAWINYSPSQLWKTHTSVILFS